MAPRRVIDMFARDAEQQALSFLVSQLSYIEPQVYRIRYPQLDYAALVPVDTTPNEWVKSITFFSVDMVGRADWFHADANDVPIADITRNKYEQAVEMAAVGYRYNLEELAQASMLPQQLGALTPERALACRRAYEEFMYFLALWGDTRKNWAGLFNRTDVSVINATNTWAYQVTQGQPGITAIMQDFNGLLTNIWLTSNTVEMADTLLLPLAATNLLTITQLPNTNTNLMSWLEQNNMYTKQTRQPLTILGVRGLDTAGAGGTARAVAYRRDPEVLKMYIPMPHRFMQPRQTGALKYEVPGIFRTAGVDVRYPMAMRYLDGI